MASYLWQITSNSFRDRAFSWGNCGQYWDLCLKKPPDSYYMPSLSVGWTTATLFLLDFRPNPSGISMWSKMHPHVSSGVYRNMTVSLPQWRMNSTGCVFRSESVLNWVLWCTKLFAEKVLHIWGNCILVSDNFQLSNHRSANWGDLFVPRTHTATYGRRAFSAAGPATWNSIPVEICQSVMISLEAWPRPRGQKTWPRPQPNIVQFAF